MQKDLESFQRLLIQKYEVQIKILQLENERRKISGLLRGPSDLHSALDIKSNEDRIRDYQERIETAKEDVTQLYEYSARIDSRDMKINGLSPYQLAYKYYQEIEIFNQADRRHFAPGNKGTNYPNKFDKLSGLIDIAKQEKDHRTIEAIKRFNLDLPEEIKAKLES